MTFSKRLKRTFLHLNLLEERIQPAGVRAIDGTGNNLQHTDWGAAGATQLRLAPAAYGDNISSPTIGRPSARVISNAVADQGNSDIISRSGLSAMTYAWGQFLDHDLDLTPGTSPAVSFNVAVPTGDPYFDPNSTGTKVIPMSRSAAAPGTGTSATNPRQQLNNITAWLDGSQIYGSDTDTADKLRTHTGGRMKTSAGDMLPLNNSATFPTGTLTMANDAHVVPDNQLFAAGDVRANENVELTSLHTLFIREHNHIADRIHQANPTLSDEQIYQQARARVIAELQVITYQEWIPNVLGPGALRPYRGYNPAVNPGIADEFSTAAFRLGHSMLGDDIEFLDNVGAEVAPEVPLSQAFFNPTLLNGVGIGPVLKYLASDPSSEIDTQVVNSVRNFLFGPPGAGGFDLVSLNIQRGRDHGIADYNSMRAAYGLPKVTSFAQITANVALQQKLQSLYGNVNNIDAWVGGLAEDHVPGGNTGPLVRRVLADQFERLRDGDRFWYEINFSGRELQDIKQTTLSDLIRRNTATTNLQDNAFAFRIAIDGKVYFDGNRDAHRQSVEQGVAGRTIQLIDLSDNSVVATTTTSPQGDYHFDTNDGLRLGRYRIRQVLPPGWLETTPPPGAFGFTRGETKFDRIEIGTVRQPPPGQVMMPPGSNNMTPPWYDNSTGPGGPPGPGHMPPPPQMP